MFVIWKWLWSEYNDTVSEIVLDSDEDSISVIPETPPDEMDFELSL